jgi:O-acetyl-ADP-ribose deacetylase (regulator of RNase III)
LTITYLTGDATRPVDCGNQARIIAHLCNVQGKWSGSFADALTRRWPVAEKEFREWHASGRLFELGAIKFTPVEFKVLACHMIADALGIKYDALAQCFQCLGEILNFSCAEASGMGNSIHMPRIGCGLAGGEWSEVEPLILEHFIKRHIPVYVYDLGA